MAGIKTIEIWTPASTEETRGALPRLGAQRIFEVNHVDASELTSNLNDFLSNFRALELDPKQEGGFTVSEIELSLGVSGKGGVALIGKVEAGADAGIKVKLVRRQRPYQNS